MQAVYVPGKLLEREGRRGAVHWHAGAGLFGAPFVFIINNNTVYLSIQNALIAWYS